MVCYHPLHAFTIGKDKKTGKNIIKVTSNKVQSIYFDKEYNHWFMSTNPHEFIHNDYIDIPCGHCIGCQLKYSRDWANRCMLESLDHDESYFITLTYNDDNLPSSVYYDKDTGEELISHSLVKDDFQKFMKRLRRYYERKGYENKLRFFACGEYGPQTGRPHYHVIVFGLHLDDLKIHTTSDNGNNYYTSEFVSKCWQNKGYCLVTECTWDTCAYVARYVTKKKVNMTSDKDIYDDMNIAKEFVLMSRRPGIAKNYFDKHKDEIYKTDELFIKGKSFVAKPPKYFDNLLEAESPELIETIKTNRKIHAELNKQAKLLNSSKDYYDMLKDEEYELRHRIKSLKRKV